jgi:hypothetical protein
MCLECLPDGPPSGGAAAWRIGGGYEARVGVGVGVGVGVAADDPRGAVGRAPRRPNDEEAAWGIPGRPRSAS